MEGDYGNGSCDDGGGGVGEDYVREGSGSPSSAPCSFLFHHHRPFDCHRYHHHRITYVCVCVCVNVCVRVFVNV